MGLSIKVALAYGDPDSWLDWQIMNLRPNSPFSHGALILDRGDGSDPIWCDIHFRWLVTDLRQFPAKNYAWDYSVWGIKGLSEERAQKILDYIDGCSKLNIVYDFPQIFWQYLAGKLGLDNQPNPLASPSRFQSAEFIINALAAAGYEIEHPEGMHLYSYITQSGHLELEVERVSAA